MPLTVVNPKSNPTSPRRVLVVDDNRDTVHSMAFLLGDMGHDVQFAINGFAAVEIARKFLPEVILLDMAPPDFSGADIARRLKREPGLENALLVAVSGLGDELNRSKALDAGCSEYHVKPLDTTVLEAILARSDEANT
jgi:two-component system CheB/CheR fusion protein